MSSSSSSDNINGRLDKKFEEIERKLDRLPGFILKAMMIPTITSIVMHFIK